LRINERLKYGIAVYPACGIVFYVKIFMCLQFLILHCTFLIAACRAMDSRNMFNNIEDAVMGVKEQTDVSEITGIIAKDFIQLSTNFEMVRFDNLAQLKEELTKKIAAWMDHRFDLLLSTLYRIDIDEKRIEELFAADNREYIPSALADLIIQRQLMKINFRRKYKEGKL